PDDRSPLCFSPSRSSERCWQWYPTAQMSLTLPDDATLTSSIYIPYNYPAARACVRLNVQHSHCNALRISRTPPGAGAVPVLLLEASSLDDLSTPRRTALDGMRFDPASSLTIADLQRPFTGTAQPADQEAMQALRGR